MLKRDIYLQNTPLHEAIEKWQMRLKESGVSRPFDGETVKVIDSPGRITAEAVFAKLSSPFYHSSAMDGYAVRYADTFGASEQTPKRLKIPGQAVYVATGEPMPEGFNTVIMIEDVNPVRKIIDLSNGVNLVRTQNTENPPLPPSTSHGFDKVGMGEFSDEYIEIIKPATPWQHVRTIGEDIVVTELILSENHRIRPVDAGAMLAGGLTEIKVRRKPKVAVIPTGSEIVEPGANFKKGDIIEYNSRILSGLITEWGGEPVRYMPVPDDIALLSEALLDALKTADLAAVIAGSSAGVRDFTPVVIRELGEVILHGINIKPGKPLVLGWINNKPVLGIPGYPVSAYITFELFAKPLIHAWQGIEVREKETLKAKLSRQVASSLGMEEFLRVKVGKVGENIIASPVSRGAGVLMSIVRADGFVRIPAMMEGLGAGTEVDVELIRSKDKIVNTVMCIGSHDNTIDILANFLKKRYPKYSLSSSHVGSMGGLIALKRGEAHIAGTHLLDEETGEYNIPFINRIFSDEIILVNLVYRQQGLFVLKGNPKNIKGFEDFTRDDITFINRQQGAGTRLLTDKHLKELRIDLKKIKGYEKEEYTHMAVASAVLNGVADTGLGILAASKALGLDFIPVAKERYDLAIPRKFYESDMVQRLLEIIRTDSEFRNTVLKSGGYDVSDMGKVIYPVRNPP
ncbi:MAG: molybdopterin biosynthesis protein [Nitrospirae bacterium]|nr:molybdopterin biosynthesis protein [Nitrospirota bacterium]